jgi:hypothetical protein
VPELFIKEAGGRAAMPHVLAPVQAGDDMVSLNFAIIHLPPRFVCFRFASKLNRIALMALL